MKILASLFFGLMGLGNAIAYGFSPTVSLAFWVKPKLNVNESL